MSLASLFTVLNSPRFLYVFVFNSSLSFLNSCPVLYALTAREPSQTVTAVIIPIGLATITVFKAFHTPLNTLIEPT